MNEIGLGLHYGSTGSAAMHVNMDMDMDSPVAWLQHPNLVEKSSSSNTMLPPSMKQRDLGDSSSYLVDDDGNEYEPYSLAWRYLGMYMDCQDSNNDDDDNDDNDDNQDERRMNSQDSQEDNSGCKRKVLWAAVSFQVPSDTVLY